MLADKNRLKKKKDFENILKKGRTFKEDFLVLKVIKNKEKKIRFGFIVSKKISLKAVVRNKVKRRLRESVKPKIELLKKGVDIVIISLPGIREKSFKEIEKIIIKLLKRTGFLEL